MPKSKPETSIGVKSIIPKEGEINAGNPPINPSSIIPVKTKKETIIDILQKGLKSSKNPREEGFLLMITMLFDETKLKMISRLSEHDKDIVMKNLIFIDFYQSYYSQVHVNINIVEKKDNALKSCMCKELKLRFEENGKCPHCLGKGTYAEGMTGYSAIPDYGEYQESIYTELLKKYPEMVNNIMKLSISTKGLSRQEILSVLKATDNELSRLDGLKNWVGDQIGR